MAKILRMILLWPVAWVYKTIIFIRNRLYDVGIFKSEKFDVPVICIGNLEMGGSGKTPTADYLIRQFGIKYKVAYLSRGYKRKSVGFVRATVDSTVEDLGDEAFLIYQKWKERIALAVDSDRRRGIRNLMEQFPGLQLIILDDGMQHRRVKSKLLIQLTPFSNPFYKNELLPIGRLRDVPEQSSLSDVLIYTKAPFATENQLVKKKNELKAFGFPAKPTFISALHYGKPVNSLGEILEPGSAVVAVAGLASNLSFFDMVEGRFSVQKLISKPDHYEYLPAFFSQNQLKDATLLTTEKDFHKLVALAPNPSKIYYLPIEMEIYPEELFLKTIENQL